MHQVTAPGRLKVKVGSGLQLIDSRAGEEGVRMDWLGHCSQATHSPLRASAPVIRRLVCLLPLCAES